VARPAVHVAGFLIAIGARRMAGPVGRFGAASFLHNPRRTALTVATLAVGLGCVLWFWTMAQSFRSSLVTTLTAAVRADLVVTSSHVTSGYVEAPVHDELATRLAAEPGVAAVAASRVIDWPYEGRRIAIEAIDAQYFADPGFGRWPLADAGCWACADVVRSIDNTPAAASADVPASSILRRLTGLGASCSCRS